MEIAGYKVEQIEKNKVKIDRRTVTREEIKDLLKKMDNAPSFSILLKPGNSENKDFLSFYIEREDSGWVAVSNASPPIYTSYGYRYAGFCLDREFTKELYLFLKSEIDARYW